MYREHDPLELAGVLAGHRNHDPGGLVDREAAHAAPSSSALASVDRVARSMISADVGPPSSIVAAWMTHRAGMSPAVVSTASPNSIGALASDSR